MKKYTSSAGIAQGMLIGIIALVLIVGSAAYFGTRKAPPEKAGMEKEELASEETDSLINEILESEAAMEKKEGAESFAGAVLAGNEAKLLDFNKVDFDKALASDKLIVLYFYANWCPICKAEIPKLESAFNELKTDQVIGFRVSYNDNETDEVEKNLAKEHGVAYQHTKVFVKSGERILKSPESWSKDRYLTEINSNLN